MPSTIAAPRRHITLGVFLALLATLAVGPRAQQGTTTVKLAWDRNKDSAVGYRVHVGTESGVYFELFEVGPATTFSYESGVPGLRYYFAVSAYNAKGEVSPFSKEVSTIIGGVPSAQNVAATSSERCCPARMRATALGTVSSLAPLPDGRALFVENGRAVRLLGSHGLIPVPSLSIDDDGSRLTEVVIDPRFTETALVFVGTTETRPDGSHEFRIVRYRLVLDTLGEGAAVVTSLPYHGDNAPRFAVDDAERIYVAMPAVDADRRDAYAGRILRFAGDGSVPEENRGFSPIFAEGLTIPQDLDWDGRSIWVVGRDANARPTIARLTPGVPNEDWPRQLSDAAHVFRASLEVSAFDVPALKDDELASQRAAVIDTTHRLRRATIGVHTDLSDVDATSWASGMLPTDVAVGPRGSLFVILESTAGSFAVVEIAEPH